MCFRTGGNQNFYINHEPIEIVSSFSYRCVTFSSSRLSKTMTDEATVKGKQAIGSVITIITSKSNCWHAKTELFQSIVLTLSLPVWGLRYAGELETIQTTYYKRVLYLLKNTSNTLLCLETGTQPI